MVLVASHARGPRFEGGHDPGVVPGPVEGLELKTLGQAGVGTGGLVRIERPVGFTQTAPFGDVLAVDLRPALAGEDRLAVGREVGLGGPRSQAGVARPQPIPKLSRQN